MAAKKKKTKNRSESSQKKNQNSKIEGSLKKPSPVLFILKDILLAIVILGGLYVFVQGDFYTKEKVAEYQKSLRVAMASNQVTQEQKDKYKAEEKTNVEKLKLTWGYNFAYNKLIKQNYEIIRDYHDMTMETKMFSKLGAFGYILNNLKNNTPDTARIILPFTQEMLDDNNYAFEFNNQSNKIKINNKSRKYMNWFVYPRRLILLTEEDKNRIPSATHVMIFDKKGAEYAQVTPGQQLNNFGIYPTKQ